jgi:hypothetical protein
MLTCDIQNKIDQIWRAFWLGGVPTRSAVEQIVDCKNDPGDRCYGAST